MDIVRATLLQKFFFRTRRSFGMSGGASAAGFLGELGAGTIFVMLHPKNAALFAAARAARRSGQAARFPRLRPLEPACDSAFEAIRSAYESDNPPVLWLSPGPEALAVLPAVRVALRSHIPLMIVAPSLASQASDSCSIRLAAGPRGLRRLVPRSAILRPFCKRLYTIQEGGVSERLLEEAWRSVGECPAGPVLIDLRLGAASVCGGRGL